jgi:hypothetical protein
MARMGLRRAPSSAPVDADIGRRLGGGWLPVGLVSPVLAEERFDVLDLAAVMDQSDGCLGARRAGL